MRNTLLSSVVFVSLGLALSPFESDASTRACTPSSRTVRQSEFQVEVSRYAGSASGDRTLLVIPPTGGTNVIDRDYAFTFCKAGFDVLILNHWTGDDEYALDLGVHERHYGRVQRAIGLLLEEINSRYIGVLGTSVGAIHAAVAASVHDRIDAVFTIVGGGPISEVIAGSDQKVLRDVWKLRRSQLNLGSKAEYAARLDAAITLDPFKLPPKYLGKDLGMVLSTNDTVVPTQSQLNLQELWQPSEVIRENFGHTPTIVKTWLLHKNRITAFFIRSAEKRLKD